MQRIIFHVDVNSAFLSWTAKKLLQEGCEIDLRTIPAVVGGDESKRHGVVLAKSESAKALGISTGESLFSARKKCPSLVVELPDFTWYVQNSNAMIGIMQSFTPDVYQYSIDEAFLDMTGMDLLMGPPLESAKKLQTRIREELGFTVNIGISSNYLLAKMASDFEKPDRIHTLFPEEIREKMWPLPVSDLFSVGRSARMQLEKRGIHTIGQLATIKREFVVQWLGGQGGVIWDYANGQETSPIVQRQIKEKSYGNSLTTPEDLTSLEAANQLLLSLVETVAARIRLDKKKVSVVSVNLVDSDFRKWSHQRTLPYATDTTTEIYRAAKELLMEAWDDSPIRLLGVSAGKAVDEDAGYQQLNLFGDQNTEKQKKLDRAMDQLREKYGDRAVLRASLMGERRDGTNKAEMEK